MMKIRVVLFGLLIALIANGATAQDVKLPEAQQVEIKAADDLMLVGDFYPVVTDTDQPRPAVLLMHMLGSKRSAWQSLIPALWEKGYHVLTVDLRGHGETGGGIDWPKATADVQTWLDWLRAQKTVRGEAIAIIGASIGSNLALLGCADDQQCVTAIALSPGLDYYGLKPQAAVVTGLRKRSALLVASQADGYSADSVKQLLTDTRGDVAARIYAGGAHGTEMFDFAQSKGITPLILAWLDEHTPPVQN
jgi:alpha-beta hydrolase superfamily lysophospholipase